MKKIIILAISLAGIVESQAETWTGKVLSVQSGDRLTVQRGKGKASLRVAGIEAPAPNKRWGKQSRASLSDMCLRRPASVKRDSPSSKDGLRRLPMGQGLLCRHVGFPGRARLGKTGGHHYEYRFG